MNKNLRNGREEEGADALRDETRARPEASAGAHHERTRPSLQRRLAVRRLLRAEVAYIFGLVVFAALTLLAHYYAYFGWDVRAANALYAFETPSLLEFMRLVSVAGDRWIPFALTGAVALLFFSRGRFSEGSALILSAAGSAILNKLLKITVGRPRPSADIVGLLYSDDAMSFPSGHVTFYVCFFGFLFFVAFALLPRDSWRRRTALLLLALPVLLIGPSRIYLRAHWPSDTLGAYLSGGLWLALSLEIYRRRKGRRRAGDDDDEATGGPDDATGEPDETETLAEKTDADSRSSP